MVEVEAGTEGMTAVEEEEEEDTAVEEGEVTVVMSGEEEEEEGTTSAAALRAASTTVDRLLSNNSNSSTAATTTVDGVVFLLPLLALVFPLLPLLLADRPLLPRRRREKGRGRVVGEIRRRVRRCRLLLPVVFRVRIWRSMPVRLFISLYSSKLY